MWRLCRACAIERVVARQLHQLVPSRNIYARDVPTCAKNNSVPAVKTAVSVVWSRRGLPLAASRSAESTLRKKRCARSSISFARSARRPACATCRSRPPGGRAWRSRGGLRFRRRPRSRRPRPSRTRARRSVDGISPIGEARQERFLVPPQPHDQIVVVVDGAQRTPAGTGTERRRPPTADGGGESTWPGSRDIEHAGSVVDWSSLMVSPIAHRCALLLRWVALEQIADALAQKRLALLVGDADSIFAWATPRQTTAPLALKIEHQRALVHHLQRLCRLRKRRQAPRRSSPAETGPPSAPTCWCSAAGSR